MGVLLALVIIGSFVSISVIKLGWLLFLKSFTVLWTLISAWTTQLNFWIRRRFFLDYEKVFLFTFKILFLRILEVVSRYWARQASTPTSLSAHLFPLRLSLFAFKIVSGFRLKLFTVFPFHWLVLIVYFVNHWLSFPQGYILFWWCSNLWCLLDILFGQLSWLRLLSAGQLLRLMSLKVQVSCRFLEIVFAMTFRTFFKTVLFFSKQLLAC